MAAFLVVLLVIAGVPVAQAEGDLIPCEQIEARWRQTAPDAALAEWEALYEQAYYDSDCGSEVYAAIGLDIIGRQLDPVGQAYEAEVDAPRFDTLRTLLERLQRLDNYGDHWRLSFLQGEVLRKLRNPVQALAAYQESLALVDDEELTPAAPPPPAIARLRDRLDEAAVIVAQVRPVRLPVNRNGQLISQYSFSSRGFKRQKVPVPIQFVYAKDVMTGEGRETFAEVLKTLKAQGSPAISLVGHTDPIGSNDYNLLLSFQRAEAIKRALQDHGYCGAISTTGMGERQPFPFDDPGLYRKEQRHAADRRVEIILQSDSQGSGQSGAQGSESCEA